MLANGVDAQVLGPQRAASLTMLLNAFDRNHNGKLDPEERPATVQHLIKRDERQGKLLELMPESDCLLVASS
jgi:hypothetical protein